MRSTSGHRLDPPMPNSRTCLNFAFFTSAENRFKVSRFVSCSSVIVNQPSQLLSSVLLHRDASFCHSRATLLFFLQSSSEASTASFNSFGSLLSRRFTLTHAPCHDSR